MVVQTSTRMVSVGENEEKKVTTLTYHCEDCRSFVRDEEREEPLDR